MVFSQENREAKSLKQRAVHAAIWAIVEQFGANGLSVIFMIALARLLTPEQFGSFAGVSLVVLFTSRIAMMGVDQAIIQLNDLDDIAFETAIWMTLAASTVSAAGVALIGPVIAGETSTVAKILPLAAPMIVFNVFSDIVTGRLRRNLQMDKMAKRTLASNLASGGIAVPLAYYGFGVYSLLAQQFIGSLLSMMLLIALSRFRPTFRVSKQAAVGLIRAGLPIFGNTVMAQFNRESPRIFVGFFLGVEALGLISITMRTMYVAFSLIGQPLFTVTLPVMSEVRRTGTPIGPVFLRLFRLVASIAFPGFLLIALLRRPIVELLLGSQWSGTISLFWPVFLSAIPLVISVLTGSALVATGYAKSEFGFSSLRAAMNAALLSAAAPFGLEAMAWAYFLRSMISEPIQMLNVLRRVEVGFGEFLLVLSRPLLASLAMVSVGEMVKWILPETSLVQVGATVLIGALGTYALVLLLIDRRLVSEVRTLTGKRKRNAWRG